MIRRARAHGGDGPPTRAIVVVACVLAALALVAPALVAAVASGRLAAANAVGLAAGDVDAVHLATVATFDEILLRNLSAAALLVAGAPLAGLPTVVGGTVIGFGVGAGMRVVVEGLGPVETAARVLAYAPLEFVGIVAAAAAGFAPIVAVAVGRMRASATSTALRSATHGLKIAAGLAAIALVCLVVAAGVEAILIDRFPR